MIQITCKSCTLHITGECDETSWSEPCSLYDNAYDDNYDPTINDMTNKDYEYFAQCHYGATHSDK